MPFYRNILKNGWKITWRNKYLWWFGIFAAMLGNGAELQILFNNTGADPGQALFPAWQKVASTGAFSWHTLANVGYLLKYDSLNMIFVLLVSLVCLAVFLLLIWLAVVSQAAIVNNSAAILSQKKKSSGEGFKAGRLNFWPVLAVNFLVKGLIYLVLVVISLPAIFFQKNLSAFLFYVFGLAATFLAVIILSFIAKYAIAHIVINKRPAGQAMIQGWRLFRDNWLISFEMAIILFVINMLVGLAVVLLILTLAVPFLFLGLIFYYSFSIIGAYLVAALAFICLLALAAASGAALSVFQIATLTSLFLELSKKRGASKLIRIVNGLIKAN